MELVQQIQAKQAEAPKADKGEKKKAKQATSGNPCHRCIHRDPRCNDGSMVMMKRAV
jgi:hypothetical protein